MTQFRKKKQNTAVRRSDRQRNRAPNGNLPTPEYNSQIGPEPATDSPIENNRTLTDLINENTDPVTPVQQNSINATNLNTIIQNTIDSTVASLKNTLVNTITQSVDKKLAQFDKRYKHLRKSVTLLAIGLDELNSPKIQDLTENDKVELEKSNGIDLETTTALHSLAKNGNYCSRGTNLTQMMDNIRNGSLNTFNIKELQNNARIINSRFNNPNDPIHSVDPETFSPPETHFINWCRINVFTKLTDNSIKNIFKSLKNAIIIFENPNFNNNSNFRTNNRNNYNSRNNRNYNNYSNFNDSTNLIAETRDELKARRIPKFKPEFGNKIREENILDYIQNCEAEFDIHDITSEKMQLSYLQQGLRKSAYTFWKNNRQNMKTVQTFKYKLIRVFGKSINITKVKQSILRFKKL